MKKLVIYFSRAGENYMSDGIRNIEIGNTEIVAGKIKDIVGANLYKVDRLEDYPVGYRDCVKESIDEFDEMARPKLKYYINNIDDYDVIYIGAPIWCGHMPMPMFTALEGLNFKGKIVKPFSTHEGSGLANIMDDIKFLCKGATIKEGLAIKGSNANKADIESWVLDI